MTGRSAPELHIGSRLRRLRKNEGLSLDALAKVSGVSKAMLSQIEQNKVNPTVAVLYRIAQALHVDLTELIGAGSPRHQFEVIRRDDRKYLFASNDLCTVRTLSPLSLDKDIEFYRIELGPEGTLDSDPHFQNTTELLTVVSGTVKVRSADREVVLHEGDAAYYSVDVPHAIVNVADGPSVCYLVVKYRAE